MISTPLKDIKLKHDTYVFNINPLNFYKGNKHDGCQIIAWYKDNNNVLQGIYRDSIYGRYLEMKLPKEMPKDLPPERPSKETLKATISKERSRLISELKKTIKPLLWTSGFVDNDGAVKIFAFDTAKVGKLNNHETERTYTINGLVVKKFLGFTEDGIIDDACGGGMATIPFKDMPIEDLFKIENLLNNKFIKFMQARIDMKGNNK